MSGNPVNQALSRADDFISQIQAMAPGLSLVS